MKQNGIPKKKYGGKYYMVSLEIFFSFQQWKNNGENPLRIDKVIAMSLV